jgi:outer membrane biosynthesis protein TonB
MPLVISRKIIFVVLSVHILLLGMILFGPALHLIKPPRKPLVVKTVVPKAAPKTSLASVQTVKQPSIAKPAAKSQPAVIQSPTAKPRPTPQAKPAASPAQAAPKKAPPVMDKTVVKKKAGAQPVKKSPPDNRAKISEQLKRDLAASIAKIEGKAQAASAKSSRSASTAIMPIALQIDADSGSLSDFPSDYSDQLVGFLHQSLHLPEFGEVKIQLTLHQDGRVAKLVVLKSESDKNKRYLEGSLPQLAFPSFSGSFAKKREHTFILTFCSEL